MVCLPCLVLLVYTAGSVADIDNDPCKIATALDDVRRSITYVRETTEAGLCDMSLRAGWYRFNSSAGTKMPDHCIERNHCGTVVPIWMDGEHPAVAEDIVIRKACVNLGTPGKCCERYVNIRVKNCSEYYVYKLYATPSCPMAYCAGHRLPCPLGKWSANGLEPGCRDEFPKLLTDPVLEGPVVNTTTFAFHCVIDLPGQHPDQRLEMVWLFDGQEDAGITTDVLNGTDRTSILEGYFLKGHIGQDLGCKVRSYYEGGPDIKSPWRYSNTYRAEIKVEPAKITVGEDGTDQNITLTSTIPVVCDEAIGVDQCVVIIQLDSDGPKENLVMNSPCAYTLKSSDWNHQTNTTSTSITVSAAIDNTDDHDQHMILSFREIFAGGRYNVIFNDFQLPPVQVDVVDSSTKTCTMMSDPHITDFRGLYFQLYELGVFTMYRYQDGTPEAEFELQVHTFPCATGVSCICGLAIQEKTDVIRLDACTNLRATLTLNLPTAPLREGTVIKRSTGGKTTVIYFPSGREVKVNTVFWRTHQVNYNNVYLTVPGVDKKGSSGGICGTFNSNIPNNHYVYRDGTHERECGSGCQPVQFEMSWRVELGESLFAKIPEAKDDDKDNRYCQCDNRDGDKRLNCTVAADIYHRVQHCGGTCEDQDTRTNPDDPTEGQFFTTRSVSNIDQDEPDPPITFQPRVRRQASMDWPTDGGITQESARTRCLTEMQKSQLWLKCQHLSSILNSILANCISDTFYTDSYDMAESALSSFTSQCQSELSLDPSNYVTTPEGHSVMKQELTDDVCSTFCLRHGNCVSGKCVCRDGFVGDNCQLDGTKGPQLLRKRGPEYCDTNERPCRKIFFDAENFQSGDGFICKSQEVLENGQLSTELHFEKAIFINSIRLACIVPDAKTKTDKWIKTFSVSATFNGNQYGNALNVPVYDSTCQTCDNDTGCVRKLNTCLIDNLCYADGESHPGDATRRCMASLTNDSWTRVSLCNGEALGDEWTVFQRRLNGSQDFYLGWDQYVTGFGRNDSDYWMGLEPLHQLTSSGSYELRVDLKDWNETMASASYSNFSISDADDDYKLYFDQFIGGNAGDSLSKHQHMPFSTKDADHDLAFTGSCADWYHGGWWYNACQDANLNGKYVTNNTNDARDGIQWNSFRGQGHSLKCTEMRVRPTPAGTASSILG